MNARGNKHTLGIRILALWLYCNGIENQVFNPPLSPEALVQLAPEIKLYQYPPLSWSVMMPVNW
jgi:hypothetical protein